MAQQTRISKVCERYAGFVDRFPDVRALADADLDDLMKAWEGLGYYSRARNLRRAARIISAQHGGHVPDDPSLLRALPGIGAYTAGAIASQAFGRPEPSVDGNTRRVLARLLDLESPSPRELDAVSRSILEAAPGRAADVNQALMDLGSQVCRPRGARCSECPIREACGAHAAGTVDNRPARRRAGVLPHQDVAVAVVWRRGRILIARRPEEGLLGGLWEFPGGKVEEGESPPRAAAREVREEMGIVVRVGELIARVEHAFSHLRITLYAFDAAHVRGSPSSGSAREWRWVPPGRLGDYAFPAANRTVLARLRGQAPDTA